jgi:cell division protease FtsH
MGGRAAEEVVYSGRTTGAENDMQQATNMSRQMVTRWGMSDKVGPMTLSGQENPYLAGDVAGKPYSEAFSQLVDTEVQGILFDLCHSSPTATGTSARARRAGGCADRARNAG